MLPSSPGYPASAQVVGVVRRAVHSLGALVGGREKSPIEAPGDPPDAPIEIGIESLPLRFGEVLEISGASLRRSDEKDIVAILGPKRAHIPIQIVEERNLRLPAQAGFPGIRDHLLERRIGGQRIGQAAGCAGSAQPSSMDVGARLPWEISRIGIHAGERAPGDPDGGIESLKHIVAVERAGSGNGVEPVEIVDRIPVVAPGDGHIHVLPESERVGEIEAPVRE